MSRGSVSGRLWKNLALFLIEGLDGLGVVLDGVDDLVASLLDAQVEPAGACEQAESCEGPRQGLTYHESVSHEVRGALGRDVLPDPQDGPAGAGQELLDPAVSGGDAFELGQPVVGVCAWPRAVPAARVPEATVDEHGHAVPGEDDVGPDLEAGTWTSRLTLKRRPWAWSRERSRSSGPVSRLRLARMAAETAGEEGKG